MVTAKCISAPTRSRLRRSPTPSAIWKTAIGPSCTRKGVQVHDAEGTAVERPVLKSHASAFLVDKGNHRHFMAKEIHEQPEVVGHTLAHYLDMGDERVRCR